MVEEIGGKQAAAFEPFEDYLLIDQIPIGVTAGGVVVPEDCDAMPPIGKVVSVGPGRTLESGQTAPMGCKAGDIVVFKTERYRPACEVELDRKKYLLLRAVDVMGCLKRAA